MCVCVSYKERLVNLTDIYFQNLSIKNGFWMTCKFTLILVHIYKLNKSTNMLLKKKLCLIFYWILRPEYLS